MTPSTLELLMHHHVVPGPHPRSDAPAIQEGLKQLVHHGLIEAVPAQVGVYETTEKGAAHIQQLCALPFPEYVYIDYKGEKI